MRSMRCVGLVTSVVILGAPLVAAAQVKKWSDPATWNGQLPKAGDVVNIPLGTTIVLDTATPALKGLRVQGALVAGDADLSVTSDYVLVDGGLLQIGTAERPFARRATITLTGTTSAPNPATPEFGNKVLAVRGGTLQLHGRSIARSWTRLSADVAAGATTITLAEPPGWQAGDTIVLATSTRRMNEYDVATIAAISGSTVSLTQPLKYKHLGAVRMAGPVAVDVRAEVGLLSHNIVIQGDEASTTSKIGGHAMFSNGARPATVQIARTEFRRMGQLNVAGRYPVHFHEMGATQNCYITQSAVRDTIQRGIVLHDVNNVIASQNVIFNVVGHNFVVEDEHTTGNLIDSNLSLINRQASPLQTNPTLVAQSDRLPANFWMKTGANTVTRNVAAGSFDSGFVFDGIDGAPINFRNNVAHAAMGLEGAGPGDFDLAAGMLIVSGYDRPLTDRIEDNLVYHNSIGMWPEEAGMFEIKRLLAADNDLQTENRGVGNKVCYENPIFVGTLTEPREYGATAVHFQYGSDVLLENPLFVNSAGASLISLTDVAEPVQGNVWISGARFVGTPGWFPPGDTIYTALDDSLLPRGTYVPGPQYAPPGATPFPIVVGDEGWTVWRTAVRPSYAELDVRDRARPNTRVNTTRAIRRSDGITFTGGMFGYTAILDADLSYDIQRTSSSGYAVRLSDESSPTSIIGNSLRQVLVSVPVTSERFGVYRNGTRFEKPSAPLNSARLRLALSDADFAANPLSTYLYDAATKRVRLYATATWATVVPGR